ncbi:MAG: Crp/Fnr family transcriptional regulator [Chloroflexota bacterium]|nr:MAG: Crp/Fnr family transcriptional regulator [Chloroflexota bacterium]
MAEQVGGNVSSTRIIPEAAEALAAVPCLAKLCPECPATFERLALEAIRREYVPDQIVFLEGEPCAGLYFVQKGWLKSVKMSPAGREQIVRVIGPGEVFNSTGFLIESATNPVSVVALEPAKVWLISRESFLGLMEQCPRLARIIIQHLAERVQDLLSLVEDLSLHPVEARLAHFLLEQSTAEMVQRRRRATQAELAARLGTVPDVINRALRSLAKEGLITLKQRRIHILDCRELAVRARYDQ